MKKRRRWRRVLILLAGVLAALVGSASYLLRPAALRERVRAALAETGLRLLDLDDVSFELPCGVRVSGLRVEQPGVAVESVGPLLDARAATITLDAVEFLRGKEAIRQIICDGPRINIVLSEGSNAPATSASRPGVWPGGRVFSGERSLHQRLASALDNRVFPDFRLDSANVRLFVMRDGRAELETDEADLRHPRLRDELVDR
ncbi:MAG: hypothetical protein HZB38_04185, partial [Planctomycetes bacterium]|nr:hypothetical protein [Planctomycetota bacterium]